MDLEIRLLRDSDVPAALRLKELARWNQTEYDWRRLLELEPNGCFCATSNGEVVGTATTTSYGQDLAWIGMVLVDPEHRRQGIGTKLMNVAMNYLDTTGVTTIKLDATPAGQPVYQRLGFTEESLVERWEGAGTESTAGRSGLPEEKQSEMLSLDHHAFGTDRTKLMSLLMNESSIQPCTATDADNTITGFALARRGAVATYIGPVVANDAQVASTLLDEMLGQLEHHRVYLDLNTEFDQGRRILSERGFTKQRDLIRMSYGKKSVAGTSSLVFAIAGPELG
jgi:ribosomal protein S18 acetylase RimI-like enzyme